MKGEKLKNELKGRVGVEGILILTTFVFALFASELEKILIIILVAVFIFGALILVTK